jgi:hypothetical protein
MSQLLINAPDKLERNCQMAQVVVVGMLTDATHNTV